MSRIALVASVVVALAGSAIAACRPAGPPPAAPAPTTAPAPRPAAVIDAYGGPPASFCVVQNGRLAIVEFDYNPSTGDSTVNGRPLREVYPVTAEYAAVARWYAMNEPITFAGRRYVKYGLPRQLGHQEVVPVGSYQGVPVFAKPGDQDVIFLPTGPGCHFQPYELGHTGAAVRG